jgi:phosphoribosylformylglycinamidine cyclo-ligase
MSSSLTKVNYDVLDRAKNAFIEASRSTLKFAERYGIAANSTLGASANLFQLNLEPFYKAGLKQLSLTLVPEGLGTADDARPDDLSSEELTRFWYNIGVKSVATMTNDVASSGLQPLLLGLYLPSSTPERVFSTEFMSGFLTGVVDSCKKVGCVYLCGETPELRTKIYPDRLDIAGAVCGFLPTNRKSVDSQGLKAGDKIVFLSSTGPHENGFTSLRAIADKVGYRTRLKSGQQFWQAINAPSVLYAPIIGAILESSIEVTNLEPITGHGWLKLMRPKHSLRYVIEQPLKLTEVFEFVQEQTKISRYELVTTFNCGVGLAVFVPDLASADAVIKLAKQHGVEGCLAGYTEAAEQREVVIKPWDIKLEGSSFALKK